MSVGRAAAQLMIFRQFVVFTHLHLRLGEQAWPHFEEDALVLLHRSDGALDHGAGLGPALVQLRLELGQGPLGPEKTNWTQNNELTATTENCPTGAKRMRAVLLSFWLH